MDKVLETVIESIEFTFEKDILVKPLAPLQLNAQLNVLVVNTQRRMPIDRKYWNRLLLGSLTAKKMSIFVIIWKVALMIPTHLSFGITLMP